MTRTVEAKACERVKTMLARTESWDSSVMMLEKSVLDINILIDEANGTTVQTDKAAAKKRVFVGLGGCQYFNLETIFPIQISTAVCFLQFDRRV